MLTLSGSTLETRRCIRSQRQHHALGVGLTYYQEGAEPGHFFRGGVVQKVEPEPINKEVELGFVTKRQGTDPLL